MPLSFESSANQQHHPRRSNSSSYSEPSLDETDDDVRTEENDAVGFVSTRCSGWPRLVVCVTPAKNEPTDKKASGKAIDDYEIRIAEADRDLDTDPIGATSMEFSVFHERFAALVSRSRSPAHGWFWDNKNLSRTEWFDWLCCCYDDGDIDINNDDEWTQDRSLGRAWFMEVLLEAIFNHQPDADGAFLESAAEALGLGRTNRLDRIAGRRKQIAEAHERQRSRWERAQEITTTTATTGVVDPEARPPTALRFDTTMRFGLTTALFSCTGNGTVVGPGNNNNTNGEKPWFLLERTDFPLGDMMLQPNNTYRLVTADTRVPLLEIKTTFDCLCDIHYVASNGSRIEALGVELDLSNWSFFVATGNGPLSGRRISVRGRDETRLATIVIDGREAAFVDMPQISNSNTSSWTKITHFLTVRPHQDCLLLVGLAYAVVRLKQAARQNYIERRSIGFDSIPAIPM